MAKTNSNFTAVYILLIYSCKNKVILTQQMAGEELASQYESPFTAATPRQKAAELFTPQSHHLTDYSTDLPGFQVNLMLIFLHI